MFYALHRLLKLSGWILVALLLAWLYTQREAIKPLWVWYDVYQNGGLQKTGQLPTIGGTATQIQDGQTFQLESDKKFYTVRLTGFAMPEPPLSASELKREFKRREALKERIFHKPVTVGITYSNQNSFLGIVRADGTNLNLFFLTNGLSSLKPDYIKTAPRDVQYQFFSAERWRAKHLHENNAEVALKTETN
jgi:hypothetical protein